jgi:hypothetical protein
MRPLLPVLAFAGLVGCREGQGTPKVEDAPQDTAPPVDGDTADDSGSDCGRGSPSAALSARVTSSGEAFSGEAWSCTVDDVVDPIGEGVTLTHTTRLDGAEVVDETDRSRTLRVPYPDPVSDNDQWGLFRWAACSVTLTDSAGCSVEVRQDEYDDGWYDPRTPADIRLDRVVDLATGEGTKYMGASYSSDPPTSGWALSFEWYRNGERLDDSGSFIDTTGFAHRDEVRAVIVWDRGDIELRGEDTLLMWDPS